MGYILAHIKLKYGGTHFRTYDETRKLMISMMEECTGWKLHHRLHTQYGLLGEVFHVWQVRDAAHVTEGRQALGRSEALADLIAIIGTCIKSESTRYMEGLDD